MSKLTPGKEYEKKFLVRVNELPHGLLKDPEDIEQGYLCLAPQVRVRVTADGGVMELKGDKDMEVHLCEISRVEGQRLLRDHASKIAPIIKKERFVVPAGFDGLSWEIDFFQGRNEGLVVAELEMPRKSYSLKKKSLPRWIVRPEVTKDARFKNKNLALHPFRDWPKDEQEKIFRLMGV